MTKPLIFLSAGGTGGHIMPAQALAHELRAKGYDIELLTDKRGLKFVRGFGDVPVHVLKAGTLPKGAFFLLQGIAQAINLIIKKKPAIIVGFGGYPSFPGMIAAQLLGVPTILHEQNAILGKANKALALGAKKIALSWPNTKGMNVAQTNKSVVVGNPVRSEILALKDKNKKENETFRIVVMGGSLGATIFSEVLPASIALLNKKEQQAVEIIQQCREADIPSAQKAYDDINANISLSTFIDDVAGELSKADLFIGRSGASTVAEMAVAGVPAIFVPYPHHKDQQQKHNADAIANQGGAWTIEDHDFTPEALALKIQEFMTQPEILNQAAIKSKACGQSDAAAKLTALVEELI